MKRRKLMAFWLGLILLAAAAGGGYLYKQHHKPVFSQELIAKANFNILAPTPDANTNLESQTVSYNSTTDVLYFNIDSYGNIIKISEQQTPQVFSDVPQAYSALLQKMQLYSEVNSAYGTIELTHPKELHGAQTAVLNNKGTLLFARPTQELSPQQWKDFFNNLEVVR